jgi:hypothetical protein
VEVVFPLTILRHHFSKIFHVIQNSFTRKVVAQGFFLRQDFAGVWKNLTPEGVSYRT